MTAHPKEMQHINECSVGEVRLLSKLLQILPDVDPLTYFSRTYNNIDALPSRLKRPNAIVRACKPYSKPRAPLCALHNHLHPKIVNSVFSLIALETKRVRRLRQMHILLLDATKYEKTFQESASEQQKWKFQIDECEGCMVARIASDPESVLDLRCAVISRLSRRQIKHHGEPRLKIWMDLWLDNFKPSFSSSVFAEALECNKQDGLDLKDVRKRISKEKHGKKKKKKQGSKAAPGPVAQSTDKNKHVDSKPGSTPSKQDQYEDDDANEKAIDADYDAYLDIVDHYKELQSTIGPSTLKKALPDSPDPGNACTNNHPYMHRGGRNPKASATSVYSVDTIRNNDRVVSDTQPNIPSCISEKSAEEGEYIPPRANWNRTQSSVLLHFDLPRPRESKSSDKQAKSYQDLLSPHPNPCTKPHQQTNRSAVSVWDDYPVSQSTLASHAVDWSGSRGLAEQIFNSPHKHKSVRGEEWVALPDVFREELNEANSVRSSLARRDSKHTPDRSPSTRHSQPTPEPDQSSSSGRARAATGASSASGSGSGPSPSTHRSPSSSSSKSRARTSSSATSLSRTPPRDSPPTLKPHRYNPNPSTIHPETFDPTPPTLKPLKYVPPPSQSTASRDTGTEAKAGKSRTEGWRYDNKPTAGYAQGDRSTNGKGNEFVSTATAATDRTRWSHVWRMEHDPEPEKKGKGKEKGKQK